MANELQRLNEDVNSKGAQLKKIKYIVFDHDGTLVNTSIYDYALYPGMLKLLIHLEQKGIRLYVWTARNRNSTVEILRSLGIIDKFDELACGNEAKRKPEIEALENLLPGIDPKEVAMIGDSLGDIIGGSKFGASAFGAMWGHGSDYVKEAFLEHGAVESFMRVEDLESYLEKLI